MLRKLTRLLDLLPEERPTSHALNYQIDSKRLKHVHITILRFKVIIPK